MSDKAKKARETYRSTPAKACCLCKNRGNGQNSIMTGGPWCPLRGEWCDRYGTCDVWE